MAGGGGMACLQGSRIARVRAGLPPTFAGAAPDGLRESDVTLDLDLSAPAIRYFVWGACFLLL